MEEAERERMDAYDHTDQILRDLLRSESEIQNPFTLLNDIILTKDRTIKQLQKELNYYRERIRQAEIRQQNSGKEREAKEPQFLIEESNSESGPFSSENQQRQFQDYMSKKADFQRRKQDQYTKEARFFNSIMSYLVALTGRKEGMVEIPREEYEKLLRNTENMWKNEFSLNEELEKKIKPIYADPQDIISRTQLKQIKKGNIKERLEEIFKRIGMHDSWEEFIADERKRHPFMLNQIERINKLEDEQKRALLKRKQREDCQQQQQSMRKPEQSTMLGEDEKRNEWYQKRDLRLRQFRIMIEGLGIDEAELEQFQQFLTSKRVQNMREKLEEEASRIQTRKFIDKLKLKQRETTSQLVQFVKDVGSCYMQQMGAIYKKKGFPHKQFIKTEIVTAEVQKHIINFEYDRALIPLRTQIKKLFRYISVSTTFLPVEAMGYLQNHLRVLQAS